MPVQVLDPVQANTFSAGSYRVTGDLQVTMVTRTGEGEDISHYVTVDKETMMILEEELSIGGYIDSLLQEEDTIKPPTEDAAAKDTYVIVKRSYRFSDFGRSFDIQLPEATGRAIEAKTSLIGF